MTRSERLEAALVALVRERGQEIDGIRSLHAVEISLTLDDAGCIDYSVLRYETRRQRPGKANRAHIVV